MNVVTGIGWITQTEYGCVRRPVRKPYSDMRSLRADLQGDSLFSYPVKGFGKFDRISQMSCCVAALAFHDAEMSYSEDRKQDIGILGTNADGCLQSNLDYFNDFVVNGRTLGRANLLRLYATIDSHVGSGDPFQVPGTAPLPDVSEQAGRVIAEACRQDDPPGRIDGDAGRHGQ